MTHPERVEDYLEHIADAIERAVRYVGSLGYLSKSVLRSIDRCRCVVPS